MRRRTGLRRLFQRRHLCARRNVLHAHRRLHRPLWLHPGWLRVGGELRPAASWPTGGALPQPVSLVESAVPLLPVNVAFDSDGRPTEALDKSIKGKTAFETYGAVPSERIERRADGKLERVFYIEPPILVPLRSALDEALREAIEKLPIPKVMSYARRGSYYNDVKFVRPAHRLVALHGADLVPVAALSLEAGRTTEGHRFLGRREIDIASADVYAPTL